MSAVSTSGGNGGGDALATSSASQPLFATTTSPSSFAYRLAHGLYHQASDLLEAPHCPQHPISFVTTVLEAEGRRILNGGGSGNCFGDDDNLGDNNNNNLEEKTNNSSSALSSSSSAAAAPRINHSLVTSMLKGAIDRVSLACEAVDTVGDVRSGKDMEREMSQLAMIRDLLGGGAEDHLAANEENENSNHGGEGSRSLSATSAPAAPPLSSLITLKRRPLPQPHHYSSTAEFNAALASTNAFNDWATPIRVKLLQGELAVCAKVGWWQNAFVALQDLLEEERYQEVKKRTKEYEQQQQKFKNHHQSQNKHNADGGDFDAAAAEQNLLTFDLTAVLAAGGGGAVATTSSNNGNALSSSSISSSILLTPSEERRLLLKKANEKPLKSIVSPNHFIAAIEACGARNSRAYDVASCVYAMAVDRYGAAMSEAAIDRKIREGKLPPSAKMTKKNNYNDDRATANNAVAAFQSQKPANNNSNNNLDDEEVWDMDDVADGKVDVGEKEKKSSGQLPMEVKEEKGEEEDLSIPPPLPDRKVVTVSPDLHSNLLQHLAKSIATVSDMNNFRELFRDPMVSDNVPVSVDLYTAMMEGCEQAVGMPNKMEFSVALYRTLRDSQLVPSGATYTALMGVCAAEKETTTAFAYYREALAVLGQSAGEGGGNGLDTLPPRFYTNLLRAYAAGGYAQDTKMTFEVLKEAGAPLERLAYHVVLSTAESVRDAAALIEEAAQVSGFLNKPTPIGGFLVSDPTTKSPPAASAASSLSPSLSPNASPITSLPQGAIAVTPTTLAYLVKTYTAKGVQGGRSTALSLCDIHHHAVAYAAEQTRTMIYQQQLYEQRMMAAASSSSSSPPEPIDPSSIEVSVHTAHKMLCSAHPTYVKAVENALFSTVIDMSVKSWREERPMTAMTMNDNGDDSGGKVLHGSLRGLVTPSLIAMVQYNMTHNFLLGKFSPQRPSQFPANHRPLVAVLTAEVLAELDIYFEPFAKYFSSIVIPFSQLVRFKRDCGLEGGCGGGLLNSDRNDFGDESNGSSNNALEIMSSSASGGAERRIDEGIFQSAFEASQTEDVNAASSADSPSAGIHSKALSPEQFAERGSFRRNALLTFLNKYRSVTHLMSLEEELQMSPDVKSYGIPIKSLSGRAVAAAANLARGITGVNHNDAAAVGVGTLYAEANAKFYVVSTNYKECGKFIVENAIIKGKRGVPIRLPEEVLRKRYARRTRKDIDLIRDAIVGAGVKWLNPEQQPNWTPPSHAHMSIPKHIRAAEEERARQQQQQDSAAGNQQQQQREQQQQPEGGNMGHDSHATPSPPLPSQHRPTTATMSLKKDRPLINLDPHSMIKTKGGVGAGANEKKGSGGLTASPAAAPAPPPLSAPAAVETVDADDLFDMM